MKPFLSLVLLCAACSSSTGTVPSPRRDAGNPGTFCTEVCNLTSDCLAGYTCRGVLCVQDNGAPQCQSTLECQGRMGGWRADCQNDLGCPANSACVGDTSAGYCARKPTTAIPCTQTSQVEMRMDLRDGSGTVMVCGLPRAHCNFTTGACFLGCQLDVDCSGETPHCNSGTGQCECTATSCHTNASLCEQGVCRCARDADCTHSADQCFDGTCGCSAVRVCTQAHVHPNTTWVCE